MSDSDTAEKAPLSANVGPLVESIKGLKALLGAGADAGDDDRDRGKQAPDGLPPDPH